MFRKPRIAKMKTFLGSNKVNLIKYIENGRT